MKTVIVFLVAFMACYVSALVVDYGFSDDYSALANYYSSDWKQAVVNGRPLQALGTAIPMRTVDVSGLSYVRLLAIVGIALSAWILFRAFARAGCGRFTSYALATITCCTLPFQVYAVWATCFLYPFAVFLSGLAFNQCERDNGFRSATGAAALLTAALAIFQPAAMCFFLFSAIALLTQPKAPLLQRFRRHAVVAGCSMSAGYCLVKAGALLQPGRSGAISRQRLVEDLQGKAEWFVSEPLPNAISFAWYPADGLYSAAVGAFIVGGMLLYFRERRALRLSIAAAYIPLAYLPNLIVAENWAEYRTLPALSGVVVLYGYLACCGYARMLRVPSAAAHGVRAAATAACILLAALNTTTFAKSQGRELAAMRERLQALNVEKSIYLVSVRRSHAVYAGRPNGREFTRPSSYNHWSARGMVTLLLREKGIRIPYRAIETLGHQQPGPPLPDALVVNMREMNSMQIGAGGVPAPPGLFPRPAANPSKWTGRARRRPARAAPVERRGRSSGTETAR